MISVLALIVATSAGSAYAATKGPVGPQGPGSIRLERTVAVNASVTVDLPTGMMYLNCYTNQIFVQINTTSTDPNGLWATGTYGYDGTGPLMVNNTSGLGFAINAGNTSMWADLQLSDLADGRTGTLRLQGNRSGGTCRFIGQYVP
jgi:hypothetical protein